LALANGSKGVRPPSPLPNHERVGEGGTGSPNPSVKTDGNNSKGFAFYEG
jgi:hypothetical protein